MAPLLGRRIARELTAADLAAWQADVATGKTSLTEKTKKQGKAVVTGGTGAAARAMRCLSAMLSWAVRREILDENVAAKVEKFRDTPRERALTEDAALRTRRAIWGSLGRVCLAACARSWPFVVERELLMAEAIYRMRFGDDEFSPDSTWINRPARGVLRGPLRHPLGLFQHLSQGTGFDPHWETPVFMLDVTNGSVPRDAELGDGGGEWLVSQRAKEVLESLDHEAFAFLPVATRLRDKNGDCEGPPYFLCDVIRFVDALDVGRSRVRMRDGDPRTVEFLYDARLGFAGNVFRRSSVCTHKVFRLMYMPFVVACTEDLRTAWSRAGLDTNIVFECLGEVDG